MIVYNTSETITTKEKLLAHKKIEIIKPKKINLNEYIFLKQINSALSNLEVKHETKILKKL